MTSIAHHIHARFCRAMTVVHDMPTEEPGLQPIPSDKLKFYGLYKQATVGPCNTPKPSSRHLVDYAKWKAWYRLGQMDPVDAKNLYVNALVELLLEFIHRHANSAFVDFAKGALQTLDLGSESDDEGEFVDAVATNDHHDLDNIYQLQPHQLPSSYTPSVSLSPTYPRYTSMTAESHTPSLPMSGTTTTSMSEPRTPILSPQQYVFQPWPPAKDIDASTHMVSPTPVLPSSTRHPHNRQIHHHHSHHRTSNSSASSTSSSSVHASATVLLPPPSTLAQSAKRHSKKKQSSRKTPSASEQSLEILQTQVAGLTEEMLQLQTQLQQKEIRKRQFHVSWFIKTLIKHILANSFICAFCFSVLYYRRNPIAVALVDYLRPQAALAIRYLMRLTVQRLMFWKVTV